MRGRKLRWALVAILIPAGVGAFVLWPRPDRITRENYDRIREGMSRAEVEAILGPSGDYTTGPVKPRDGARLDMSDTSSTLEVRPGSAAMWVSDAAYIIVFFDDSGRVKLSGFDPCTSEPQGPLDNLLWRIKRQWHKWFL